MTWEAVGIIGSFFFAMATGLTFYFMALSKIQVGDGRRDERMDAADLRAVKHEADDKEALAEIARKISSIFTGIDSDRKEAHALNIEAVQSREKLIGLVGVLTSKIEGLRELIIERRHWEKREEEREGQ